MYSSTLLMSILAPLTTLATSGSGTTTRYWDCCKPSCAWNNLDTLGIQSSVRSCDINDQQLSSNTDQSGCDGGSAYMCSDQSPWAVSDNLAYGFAAVSSSNPLCCQCYALTFTSGPVSGQKMIVQATNTGGDVGSTQFDLAMPGGGFGIFDGCSKQWGATSDIWGVQYGGSIANTCSKFPSALQAGCGFRWGSFFQGSDNPTVNWETVACPLALTQKSGCIRIGDTPTAAAGDSASVPATSTLLSSTTRAAVVTTLTSTSTAVVTSSADAETTLSASIFTLLTSTRISSAAPAEETGADDGEDEGDDDEPVGTCGA